jgi:SdrD B-like domain
MHKANNYYKKILFIVFLFISIQKISAQRTVSGTVFQDATADNIVNGTGTNAGGLFANLLSSNGLVVASTAVSATGTYSFSSVAAGNYTVRLSSTVSTVGQVPTVPSLPTGWISTGDAIGSTQGTTSEGISAIFNVPTGTTPAITGINFGINNPPLSDCVGASIVNGTITYLSGGTVLATALTNSGVITPNIYGIGAYFKKEGILTIAGQNYDAVIKIVDVYNPSPGIPDPTSGIFLAGPPTPTTLGLWSDGAADPYFIYNITIVKAGSATAANPTGTPVALNDVTVLLRDIDGNESPAVRFRTDVGGALISPTFVGQNLENEGFDPTAYRGFPGLPTNTAYQAYKLYRTATFNNNEPTSGAINETTNVLPAYSATYKYATYPSTGNNYLFGNTGDYEFLATANRSYGFSMSICLYSISGNVFNDVTANTNSDVDGLSPNLAGLYANLLNSAGVVVATVLVDQTTGAYSFPNLQTGSYSVQLSTNQGVIDSPAPAQALPTGWANTGDEIGAVQGGNASVDGQSAAIVITNSNIIDVNFGIQQPPTANIVIVPPIVNPNGTATADITSSFGGDDPTTEGIITNIKITAFPTATATSITIGTVVYTDLASITTDFPNGITTDANGVPTLSIKIDPKDGAQTVFIPYVTIDNAGVESPVPGSVTSSYTVVSVSGNVFNDPNGANVNNSTGVANLVPVGMTAILVCCDGNVVANATVNTDGTYSFGNLGQATYTVILSTTAGTIGMIPPAPSVPLGWANTGEFTGTPDSGTDASVNGTSLPFSVTTSDIVNINFGIQQPPTPVGTDATSVVNPGGTVQSADAASLFTGTDPSGGTIASLMFTEFPTGATSITIDGNPYTTLADILMAYPAGIPTTSNGTPTVAITADPAATGATDVVFTFTVTDNAGAVSPTTSTVTLPFTAPLTLTGSVYNDVSGISNGVTDGSGLGNPSATPLYANLLSADGLTVVASVLVNNDGTYTLPVIANTSYQVQISTNQGTATQPTPVTALPTGWVNTGDIIPGGTATAATPGQSAVVAVTTTNVTNVDFGIQQPPTPVGTDATSVVNPGGTVQSANAASLFTGTDSSGGTIASLMFTEFPTGATSITIDGNPYTTLADILMAYPAGIPTTSNGTPTVAITADPAATGATDVVFTFTVTDNAGAVSPTTSTVTLPFTAPLTLTGSVYNDVTGISNSVTDGSGLGNPSATPLYANLLSADGLTVVASVLVNNDGTYTLPVIANTSYQVQISTNQGTATQPTPVTALPTGWVNTGDIIPGGTATAATPGQSAVIAVATTNVTNVDFGIQQPPTPVGTDATSVVNPGGTVQSADAASLFTGTDPSGGTIASLMFTEFPTGATSITIDGNPYTTLADILMAYPAGIPTTSNGTPTVAITADPSATGTTDVVFTFTVTDNAGAVSPTTSTVTLPFAASLPLELISFKASQGEDQVNLFWKTANEKDFSHFEVQKSQDAKEFGTISTVNGNKSNIYNQIDEKPIKGINYYRLKMVDSDGTSKISNMISVNFEKDGSYASIENPANNGEIKIMTNLKNPRFTLLSTLGTKVAVDSVETGNYRFTIKVNNIVSGIYYLNIISGKKVITKKVLIP